MPARELQEQLNTLREQLEHNPRFRSLTGKIFTNSCNKSKLKFSWKTPPMKTAVWLTA